MSAKSFVVVAPSRKSPKIAPMYHGSTPAIVFTDDQPATFSSVPRGIAMVTLAQMPSRLVRNGGTEYREVQTTAITTSQKHSGRPPGARSQARTSANADRTVGTRQSGRSGKRAPRSGRGHED